ncbi:MAG: hypothetical protein STHCBS139747_001285 [Sporothrix thermara]
MDAEQGLIMSDEMASFEQLDQLDQLDQLGQLGELGQLGGLNEINDLQQLQQLQQIQQMHHQGDVLDQLEHMSQQEIDQMNAVLSQCQMLDDGQILFGSGGAEGLPVAEDQQHHNFGQPQERGRQQVQKQQYLQRLYLQQLQVQNAEQKRFEEAEAARRQQAQASPSRISLQQPFPHGVPPYLNTAPAFAAAAFAQLPLPGGNGQQGGGAGAQTNGTPPLYYDLQRPPHAQQHPPQTTPPNTWPSAAQGVTSAPIGNAAVGQQPGQQQGCGRRPSRGRSHTRIASASARREQALQHLHPTAAPAPSAAAAAAPTTAPAPVDANVTDSSGSISSAGAEDEMPRLQDLSIMHHSTVGASTGSTRSTGSDDSAASTLSMTSSASSATITGPTPAPSTTSSVPQSHPLSLTQQHLPLQPSHQTTLSPKKQRTVSSSPKKPGRFESIYATLRNKATSMRRSRTAFMHEAAAPTVAPLATLHDATFPMENHNNINSDGESSGSNIQSHHVVHDRSHHLGDLFLDLDLSTAKSTAMGSFPPTPPLTGTASSLSSTSSTFSRSACSSAASSVADGPQFHHLVAAQYPHNPLHSHHLHNQYRLDTTEEDLSQSDMAAFVSGLVDDPFAESSAFFGGGVGTPGQHQLVMRPHLKAEYPPQPARDGAMSSACWPAAVATPNGKTPPMQPGEDNEVTPVTSAINIPGRAGMLPTASPSAYLASAAANMSGTSVIASASASAAIAAAAANANVKREALGISAMDTDEDWWQESVVESAVGEPLEQPPITSASATTTATTHTTIPSGFPPEFIAANTQAFDANGNLCYYMPDLATQGLMINMSPAALTPGGDHHQNQYYFPGIAPAPGSTGFPPAPPIPPAGEYEYRYDRASASSRRPKPRAPSAGARYHSTSRGDGLHSPRKRSSVTNMSKTSSSNGNAGAYGGDDASGLSAAAITAPSTPHGHHQLGRRSHSMQSLPRTSPTPGASGSMNALPSGAATPSNGAIRKRRSASNMRRVSSTQGITSLTAAAAITAAVGASGMPEPKTPSRRRSTSADPSRPRSAASNTGGALGGFVNFTAEDHDKLMSGVAPSGSSKTKARRERALQEKTRQFSERLVRAMQEAGGDVAKLEAEGLKDLTIAL